MTKKAEYIGKVRDKNGYAVHLFYKYRDHEYMITDEHNGYSETLASKHKREQERIDREIEIKKKENPNDKGIDLNEIFKMLDEMIEC